jgi:DNA polymerase I-like protein with 3'-5' exonuclease and polymerase domains/uracil-DNA glycosylase
MLVDECFRKADLESGEPFSGYLGGELGKLLSEVGIQLSNCYSTWAVRQYSPDGGHSFFAERKKDITAMHKDLHGKPALNFVHEAQEILAREIESCQPNVIIAFGNTAMLLLTGKWGITNWRGSTLPCILPGLSYQPKVIPVYPIGRIMAKWEWRPIAQQDLRRVIKASHSRELIHPDYNFIIRPDFGTALATLETLLRSADRGPLKLAVDIETRSYQIACMQIAWSTLDAICIPLMCVERVEGYWTLDEETVLMYKHYKLLTHRNVAVVGQNFHYDEQYFERYLLFLPALLRDTMISQHAMFSTMEKGLDFLSSMYCEYHVYWKSEGKEWTADMDEEQLWNYGCKDAVITYEVDTAQQAAIDKMGLRAVADFQNKLFWPVLETMVRGIRIDKEERNRFAMVLFEEIAAREKWIFDLLGYVVNIRSPQQMQTLFYEDLKQKPIHKRVTRAVTTDDEALRKIAEREPLLKPLCNKISEMRSLGVFLSTFVRSGLDIDGKTRCMFKTAGTETYRFASSKNAFGSGMNLQNIPKGGEEGDGLVLPNIRTLFIPDSGFEYFDIDLDSADLRVVCYEAGVPEMKAMLNEGKKVYVEVMKEYYNDPTLTKHSPQYGTFKSFCHGTNYLGTSAGLADRLGLSRHIVDELQKWYFGKFPEIKAWHEKIKNQVLTRRMVSNVFGYRFYIFGKIEGTIMNQVIAWIPQSTVGCLINRIYMNIYENLKEVEIQLQVHDSLAGQYPIAKAEWCRKRIIEEAQIVLPYSDPMIIPVGIKYSTKSWGECG